MGDEELSGLHGAALSGEEERGVAAFRGGVGISAAFEQELDEGGFAFGGGPHERGLSGAGFGGVGVGTGGEEELSEIGFARMDGGKKGRFAVPAFDVGIGLSVQEHLGDGGVAETAGEREGSFAVFIRKVGIGLALQQGGNDFGILALDRPGEGGGSIGAGGVNGGAGAEKGEDLALIPGADGVNQAKIGSGGRRGDRNPKGKKKRPLHLRKCRSSQ